MGMLIGNLEYDGIPLGHQIRGTINNEFIYRVRRGNGYASSIEGVYYQDKYPYFVPASINNSESDHVRTAFSTAVSEWQTTLTDTQKQAYRERANKGLKMSGYNLYISERIKELVS
jgi:hypothetical protein